jgi:hypothetical protein
MVGTYRLKSVLHRTVRSEELDIAINLPNCMVLAAGGRHD